MRRELDVMQETLQFGKHSCCCLDVSALTGLFRGSEVGPPPVGEAIYACGSWVKVLLLRVIRQREASKNDVSNPKCKLILRAKTQAGSRIAPPSAPSWNHAATIH